MNATLTITVDTNNQDAIAAAIETLRRLKKYPQQSRKQTKKDAMARAFKVANPGSDPIRAIRTLRQAGLEANVVQVSTLKGAKNVVDGEIVTSKDMKSSDFDRLVQVLQESGCTLELQ